MFSTHIRWNKWLLFVLLGYSLSCAANENAEWSYLKKAHFAEIELLEEHEFFELKAPPRAEDAAFTPVTIVANQAQSKENYVKSVYVFVDKNPDPLAGIYHFNEQIPWLDFSIRLRIDRYSHIRAVLVTNDGQHYLRSAFIKASGGCSAPPPLDNSRSVQQMGKMRIKLSKKSNDTYMTFQVRHPNHSGMQRDFVTQGFIPSHYVSSIIMNNDAAEPLLKLETGISMSMDPTIRLRVTDEIIENLKVTVSDSKNMQWNRDFSEIFNAE